MSGKGGEDCHYAHDESQLREKPNLYRTHGGELSHCGRCENCDEDGTKPTNKFVQESLNYHKLPMLGRIKQSKIQTCGCFEEI